MIPPLNQQGSGGRPLVGQNLLRQLHHGPIAMGAPCLERGTAARGGRRLERTLERAGVFVCVCVCVCVRVCLTTSSFSSMEVPGALTTQRRAEPEARTCR